MLDSVALLRIVRQMNEATLSFGLVVIVECLVPRFIIFLIRKRALLLSETLGPLFSVAVENF